MATGHCQTHYSHATRGGKSEEKMSLDERVKKNWIEIQKKHKVPVNAIGIKIKDNDKKTLQIWKDEGIDAYLKK